MESLTDREAEILGIYGIARRMLLNETISTSPLTAAGTTTTKYVTVPIRRQNTYETALDAAQRLHSEGFWVALFYPDWEPSVLHLVVVWDPKVLNYPWTAWPCLFCAIKEPSWSWCGGCDALHLWEKDNTLPGGTLPALLLNVQSTTQVALTSTENQLVVPSAESMRQIEVVSDYFLSDSFEEPLLTRVSRKLEWWGLHTHVHMEPLPGIRTYQFITVPLSPVEVSRPEELRKTVAHLERKGYVCGPVITESKRSVLLVCWDANIAPIFPKPSPCSVECGETQADTDGCYCTLYNAWYADWNRTTFPMTFVEQ